MRAPAEAILTYTLFPYTTLFRSLVSPGGCRDGVGSTDEWFVRAARLSHVAEQGHERLADRQRFGPLLEPDRAAAAVVACDRRDRLEVDDGRAVHLLEHRRVEQAEQLADRRAPQRFTLGGHPGGVLVVGADEIGRAHVWTPVTNEHIVWRLLLEK